MPGCSVFDCNAGHLYSIRLHKFPREYSPLWKKWLSQLNRKDFYPGNGARVCDLHFKSDKYLPKHLNIDFKGRARLLPTLKETAYPTEFLRNQAPPEILAKYPLKTEVWAKKGSTSNANDSAAEKVTLPPSTKYQNTPKKHKSDHDYLNLQAKVVNKKQKIITKSKDDRFAKAIGNIVFDKKTKKGSNVILTPQKSRALRMLHLGQRRDCIPEDQTEELFTSEDIKIDNEEEVVGDIIPPNEEELEEKNKKLTQIVVAYRRIYNHDQERRIVNPESKGHWSDSTLQKAVQNIQMMGATAYQECLVKGGGGGWPSVRTIQRHLQKIDFDPGVLDNFFHSMKHKVRGMTEEQRQCGLFIDAISLQPKVEADASKDHQSCGYPTIPENPKKKKDNQENVEDITEENNLDQGNTTKKTQKRQEMLRKKLAKKRKKPQDKNGEPIATHGLVFMLGGYQTRWKQVIAWDYTADSVDASIIKDRVVQIIRKSREIGLTVKNQTTDMGPENLSL